VKSIRTYLLTRLLGGAALVLAGAGFAVYVAVTRSLQEEFDQGLTERVLGFASLLFQVEDHVEFEFSDQLMPDYGTGSNPSYFELWREDGRLLERSDSLRGGDLALPSTPSREPLHWSAPLPDGREGRYVAQLIEVHHLTPEEGPERPLAANIVVAIARGREEYAAATREVLLACSVVGVLLMGLIALVCWTAVERGLEPTNRLAATLDAIEVEALPEHLDAGEMPRELQPVAEKTDALLRRLDAALQRERRTTADIAHELRTPISEVITVAEVALRNGRDADSMRGALGKVRDTAWRMGRSLSTLLKLARLEMGAETFDAGRVDLGALLAELLRSLGSLERERGLRVENRLGSPAHVQGDADALRIVVSNLLSNALVYSPRGTGVVCELERAEGAWRFLVENESPDLRPEDLRHLSEPFWRKDRARADRDRSGLGLALSKALAERAGMELTFELRDGKFRAVLAGEIECDPPSPVRSSRTGSHR
jgi:two-component system, OmpR family, heavy metal sensor histidine kinase CusS